MVQSLSNHSLRNNPLSNNPLSNTVEFDDTDDAQGHVESLLKITTQGRYCGTAQTTLLPYRLSNNQYIVGASNLRNHIKPDWYLNLKEEPIVQINIADATFYAKALTPTGNERLKVLAVLKEMMQYQDKIPRDTAAVVLSPLC